MQDNGLHAALVNSFNHLGYSYVKGNEQQSIQTIIALSECNEVGLGNSKTRIGKPIGERAANDILALFKNIPQINKQGFQHFEEIQMLVDSIAKDRISDIACSIIKSFLIDYSIDQCTKLKVPVVKTQLNVFDYKTHKIINEECHLPVNPSNKNPILFVPKRWLKYIPWINYDDYFENYYVKDINKAYDGKLTRIEILNFNRQNYDLLKGYIVLKEQDRTSCLHDPLFKQIPVLSVKRKLQSILSLPTGKTDNADKQYEDYMVQLMSTLLYPHLDFAQEQSRTESGMQIRDLIFYNNRSLDFLKDLYDGYDCKQMVIELKNVSEVERDHVNQLNRYLNDQFGKFGILFTRNKAPNNIFKNTIDLWAGQRRCILIMDDEDLKLMCEVYESKQRLPVEVIKKKYIEFTRKCPA
jgi:hypothetical protein